MQLSLFHFIPLLLSFSQFYSITAPLRHLNKHHTERHTENPDDTTTKADDTENKHDFAENSPNFL